MAAAFRAFSTAGDGQSSGTSTLTIDVPTTGPGGTVAVGDVATIVVQCSSTTANLTTPTGWSLSGGPLRATASSVWRLSKVLVSGDLGATVTLTLSAAQRCQALMLVASGVAYGNTTGTYNTETTATTAPSLPTVSGVPAGSLIFTIFSRRVGSTPAAVVHPPVSTTEITSVETDFGTSPELTTVVGWTMTTVAGTFSGGTGSSSAASTGTNYVVAMPATVPAGTSVTVVGDSLSASMAMPAGTVATPTSAGVAQPDVLTQLWRSGGHTITYTVAASSGGVPVQGAQALQPTDGRITDTNKPGVRRTLNLELAREVIGGRFLDELLPPQGTILTVTAHVSANSVPVADIPMGVFDVDTVEVSEGDGKISITAPDKWQRIVRSRFLVPRASQPGFPVTQQITWLIQDALGPNETVLNLATSTAQVGALSWDRDRDKAIQELAQSIGAWVYFDRTGQAVIADIPTIGAHADWLVNAGSESAVLVSIDRQRSRQNTYNVVVVSSSAAEGDAFPPQVVFDHDINSPTYAGTDPLNDPGSAGPFGIVPMFYSSPIVGSVSEALTAGTAILAQTVGLASSVSLSAVPNPQVDAWDVIDVLPPAQQWAPDRVFERHVVDTVVHPLAFGDSASPMTITGRSTRSDPYVSDVSG
jgi:hypothetical protein